MHTENPSDEAQLRSLIRICDLFREQPVASPNIPLAVLEAFLLVCLYEGASLKDLCDLSGQAQSTLSRHLLDLGERNRRGEPGLKLVAWRHPPEELRRKEYYLTPKGEALRDRMLEAEPPQAIMAAQDVSFFARSLGEKVPWYRSTTAPRKRRAKRQKSLPF
jgi:DNA-binding MarR family transcriptional regulator